MGGEDHHRTEYTEQTESMLLFKTGILLLCCAQGFRWPPPPEANQRTQELTQHFPVGCLVTEVSARGGCYLG